MFVKDFIHPSFEPFFEENAQLLAHIESKVEKSSFLPEGRNVLRFSRLDASALRVVILGQDPYPQPGAATGRSFEVGGLHSWLEPFRQSSLRNILRAVYAAQYGELLKFSEVKAKIASGEFDILPPDRLWDSLEAQGVLFLNTYLTVEPDRPLSHRALWAEFSRKLIHYIDEKSPQAAWFLWGADARGYGKEITRGIKYESRHPMMCGPWEDDFLKNPCFQETKDVISWCGRV